MRNAARILSAAWVCFLVYWTVLTVIQTLAVNQEWPAPGYAALYVLFGTLCVGACVCALIQKTQRLGGILLALCGVLFFLLNLFEIYRAYVADASRYAPEMQYLAKVQAIDALPKLLIMALPPVVAGLLFVTSYRLRRTLEEQMLKSGAAMIMNPENTPPIGWQRILASCIAMPWLVFGLLLIGGGVTGITAEAAGQLPLALTLIVVPFGLFCLGAFICAFRTNTQALGAALLILCGLIITAGTIIRIWMTPLNEPLPPTVYQAIGLFSVPPIIAGFLLLRSRPTAPSSPPPH